MAAACGGSDRVARGPWRSAGASTAVAAALPNLRRNVNATPAIVLGFDGSPGAEAALRFAAEEATLRGLRLRIVSAWEAAPAAYVGEVFAPTPDAFVEGERRAEEVVRAGVELAAGLGVEAEGVAVEGNPAANLIEQASSPRCSSSARAATARRRACFGLRQPAARPSRAVSARDRPVSRRLTEVR